MIRKRSSPRRFAVVLLWLVTVPLVPALGAGPAAPTDTPLADAPLSLAARAARRFPQPVTVAALDTRLVTEPSNREMALGRVAGVVRTKSGEIKILLKYGGFLGFGTRLIAVPVEATGLLGQFLEVLDLDQQQLAALPDWKPEDGTRLSPSETIRIGLTKN